MTSAATNSATVRRRSRPHRIHAGAYAFFLAAFALVIVLTHVPYLSLPYYWDELGQFIPAALDLFRTGQWVPHSTVPNVHPPGLMAYLAGVWQVFGYSIPATRAAMLALAALAALVSFLLAIELCKKVPGSPALFAVLLLLASPLFYTQAMLAELDLPATLFTAWALLLFLQDRYAVAALLCLPLVLVKETGAAVPVVMAAWLLFEGKRRQAAWFLLPLAALGGWIAVLWHSTGHLLGNTGFTEFNLFYPLHPVRLALAILRRIYFLVIEDFHWIGWIGIALGWRAGFFETRAWKFAATLAVVHVAAVTVLGGATLERYLLPVLPVLYAAMAAGWRAGSSRWARPAQAALFAGLIFSMFWKPPLPYPFENNRALFDFVALQQEAAGFLERNYSGERIVTAWPLTGALRRPEFGYVSRPLKVKEVESFSPARVAALDRDAVRVFAIYSRDWETEFDLRRFPAGAAVARRFYQYEPQLPPSEVAARFHLRTVGRWTRRGQWIAVLAKE